MADYHLRLATLEDSAVLAAIYRPYVVNTAITFEYDPPDENEFRRRIKNTLMRYPYVVCVSSCGEIIGYAYGGLLYDRAAYQWDAELSVYLRKDQRGHGIGSMLYRGLLSLLCAQGYRRAYACITYPNEESIGFHRSFGFVQCGHFQRSGFKFGQWHDVIWMDKALDSEDLSSYPLTIRPIKSFDEAMVSAILSEAARG
ncbi:MAG: N-acetyltransferase family protein [Bacillota bacterium]|nr:N-acetyltransferase family protein [Bacillota bacterium]